MLGDQTASLCRSPLDNLEVLRFPLSATRAREYSSQSIFAGGVVVSLRIEGYPIRSENKASECWNGSEDQQKRKNEEQCESSEIKSLQCLHASRLRQKPRK